MSWLDGVFIILLVLFIVIGARLGSLWIGACLIGGFLGGFLVDSYMLPVSGMMGHFPGSKYVAAVLLFAGGLLIALVPGYLLSRIGDLFLGFLDHFFGLLAGLLAGLSLAAIFLMLALPRLPKLSRSDGWRHSSVLRPYHHFLQDIFNRGRPLTSTSLDDIKSHFVADFEPTLEKAQETIDRTKKTIVKKVKKK